MNRVVKEWYDAKAEQEWNRLFQDAYHRLEYIVHMRFLDKYLPKRGLILDAGGGPGRYTIELAKKGYQVVLLDLSPKCLEIAKKEIKNAKVEDKVKKIVEGSIVDLSEFMDESFDAVLCLGTLCHLIDKAESSKRTRESDKEEGAYICLCYQSIWRFPNNSAETPKRVNRLNSPRNLFRRRTSCSLLSSTGALWRLHRCLFIPSQRVTRIVREKWSANT